MRRAFWLAVGLGAGVTAAVMVNRWIRRQREALSPTNLARQAAGRAGDVGGVLRDAAREFRLGMAENFHRLGQRLRSPAIRVRLLQPLIDRRHQRTARRKHTEGRAHRRVVRVRRHFDAGLPLPL